MDVVAGQEFKSGYLVAGNQPLDLVKDGKGIKRAELRFQILRCKPYRMTVGFTRLRAPGLSHIRMHPAAERNQLSGVCPHGVGEPDHQLEVAAYTGQVPCLL